MWGRIEKFAVPKFKFGYTVTAGLAEEFKKRYSREYSVIRNLPVLMPFSPSARGRYIVYQGAINEGRGFEYLIPAMKKIRFPLVICGDGNFMHQLKDLIRECDVAGKVDLKGMLLPKDLKEIAAKAALGIGLAEREGINQFHALPNKFLEYMHAGLPQLAMNFPEYKKINDRYQVAVLLDDLTVERVAENINGMMENKNLLKELSNNALKAREVYCWQEEEKKLIQFYQRVFA
jgi:glycosyltransferase involved in cell wall biosynthesis